MGRRTLIAALGFSVVLTGTGYADLMWPNWHAPDVLQPVADTGAPAGRFPISWNEAADARGLSELYQPWGEGLPARMVGARGAAEAGRSHILADERGSLSFCLYALLGLGFCKSGTCLKRMSWHIPAWYHEAGPFQIGHSFALPPDCLTSAPIHCFLQPECAHETPAAQYQWETIVSLWRRSQFTPTTLASRGPPSRSVEMA